MTPKRAPKGQHVRTIKKYPNRRLYDTVESRYITLADIRQLVIDKVDFRVIDKKSGDDITRTILLQVISEQEQQGESIMSQDFLSQIIRSYGSVMPNFARTYLEQSMEMFMRHQAEARNRFKKVTGLDPVGSVTEIAERNLARWKSLQEDVFRVLSGRPRDRDE
ncbi:MAG: polyhydroxyalkanoate synthesis repressor PhaR [Pseudomonadota bacterium]